MTLRSSALTAAAFALVLRVTTRLPPPAPPPLKLPMMTAPLPGLNVTSVPVTPIWLTAVTLVADTDLIFRSDEAAGERHGEGAGIEIGRIDIGCGGVTALIDRGGGIALGIGQGIAGEVGDDGCVVDTVHRDADRGDRAAGVQGVGEGVRRGAGWGITEIGRRLVRQVRAAVGDQHRAAIGRGVLHRRDRLRASVEVGVVGQHGDGRGDASSFIVAASLAATGGSSTQFTVTPTVAVEPPGLRV